MKPERKGLLLMIGATLFFSAMNALVKSTLKEYSFMDAVFYRSFFGSLFVLALLFRRHRPIIGPNPKLLLFRGVMGFLGLACYYYAMAYLTLADTVILNKVAPLFVMILAFFLMMETLSRWHLLILSTALFGIYNVIQPQLDIAPMAGAIGLSSALFSAIAYIIVKKLSHNHSSLQIVFSFFFTAMVLAAPVVFYRYHVPDPLDWLVFMSIGVTSASAQILMTKAYSLGSPTPISIASYADVVFSSLWGFLFFSEIQNTQALAGTVIIIASLAGLAVAGTKGEGRRISRGQ